MDRNFLAYYEAELAHVRELSAEFAALHPTVARNLSLNAVPCPDPYVERLLEGVAYLSARTRLKVDAESGRYVRNLLDALYPDLVGPAPAVSMAVLHPGPQVQTMQSGHVVGRGTRLVSSFREGLSTRATYSTAQDVTLWPIAIDSAEYLQDRGALFAAGLSDSQRGGAEAAIKIVLKKAAPGALGELSLDRLDVNLSGNGRGGVLFDAIFGSAPAVLARAAQPGARARATAEPALVGISDGEGLLPRLRPAFEGFRLLREYFLMPERFHYVRLDGLGPAMRDCTAEKLEIFILLATPRPAIADLSERDFRLFVTPLVNLFERECNVVEIDGRASSHIVHADRTRPRDFEIFRLTQVEDVESEGPEARLQELYTTGQWRGAGLVYTTERRTRRPAEDEVRRGQTRSSYLGDEVFISVARPASQSGGRSIRRLDVRALCTNRDLPMLDDNPRLSLESGDPVGRVELISAFRNPRPSLAAGLPVMAKGGENRLDDLSWRLVSQFSLNFLSLAEETQDAEPLRALLDLYAGLGDPAMARHIQALKRVSSRVVVERLPHSGPICFGKGVELTLHMDSAPLAGSSTLLLSALLNQVFLRYAAINSFVRTRTRSIQTQEDVSWPMSPGSRAPI